MKKLLLLFFLLSAWLSNGHAQVMRSFVVDTAPSSCIPNEVYITATKAYVCIAGVPAEIGATVGGGTIDGSGTANKVPKFTAAATVGNSQITDTGALITLPGNSVLGKVTKYNGVDTAGAGLVSIRGVVDLTGQTGIVAPANLLTAPAAGLYHIRSYLNTVTPGDGACTATTAFGWTDSTGAKSLSLTSVDVGSTGAAAYNAVDSVIYVDSGDVTYTVVVAGVGCTSQVWDLHLQADN